MDGDGCQLRYPDHDATASSTPDSALRTASDANIAAGFGRPIDCGVTKTDPSDRYSGQLWGQRRRRTPITTACSRKRGETDPNHAATTVARSRAEAA